MKRTELERFLNREDARNNVMRYYQSEEYLDIIEEDVFQLTTTNTDGVNTMHSTEMRPPEPYLEDGCRTSYGYRTTYGCRTTFVYAERKSALSIQIWKPVYTVALDHIEYDRLVYLHKEPEKMSQHEFEEHLVQIESPKHRYKKRCLVIGDSSCLQGYTNKEIFDKLRSATNNCKTIEFVVDNTTFLGQKIIELTKIDNLKYKAFNTAEFVDNKFTRFDFKRTLRVMNRALNYTQFAATSGVIIIRGYKDSILSDTIEKWAKRVDIPVKNLYLG